MGYTLANVTNCTVIFSICKPLPRDICVNQTNSSTCQVVTMSDGKTYYFNIGNFQGNKEFQPTGKLVKRLISARSVLIFLSLLAGGAIADVGFTTIRQGSANSEFCSTTFTTIMSFNCERSTIWDRTRNNATLFVENTFNFPSCLVSKIKSTVIPSTRCVDIVQSHYFLFIIAGNGVQLQWSLLHSSNSAPK